VVAVVPTGPAAADGVLVQPGDTLSGLAWRLGVGQGTLAATNGIANPDVILAGRVLQVPRGAPLVVRPAAAGTSSYRVQPGDTLWDVASKLGVSSRQLAQANNLRDPDHIEAGRALVVPSRSAGPGRRAVSGPVPATRWGCPVPGARFVNDYNYLKPNGQRHAGVDLFAPRGTPVVAPVSGVVAAADNRLGGKAFSLSGDDGNRYYGAHLDRHGRTGRVAAGTVIGYVGNTGDARGGPTHLHFQFHPRGGGDASPYHLLTVSC
jgi:murein DD-endopeptidase MepM/ murein hydrolase activator NlpD